MALVLRSQLAHLQSSGQLGSGLPSPSHVSWSRCFWPADPLSDDFYYQVLRGPLSHGLGEYGLQQVYSARKGRHLARRVLVPALTQVIASQFRNPDGSPSKSR